MNAQIAPGYTKKRQRLSEVVPLDAPFTLFVSPTQICNFRCFYCTQSKSAEEKEKAEFLCKHIAPDLFKKIADDSKEFGGKIKRVLFTGLGEPLTNPALPDMIDYMRSLKIAGSYEIVTNAYLLTHDMADRLLDAGLTFLRVSIQGLTETKYKEVSGVNISYERLLDNLTYFYSRKGKCRIYIKMMDECFTEGETKEDFFRIFGNICDDIFIEHLVKAQPSMMDKYASNVNSIKTFYGEDAVSRSVCPYAFYSLQIDANGETFPCPPLGFPKDFSLGNVREESVYNIWHSKRLFDLQKTLLTEGRSGVQYCDKCENYLCFTPDADNLDQDRSMILERLEEKGHV